MKKFSAIFLISIIAATLSSQTGIPKAQAMFIYNFSRLIEWPVSYKTGPFVIEAFGNSSLYNELELYAKNKLVGSQAIHVKKIDSPQEIGRCHIIFVPFNKTKQLPDILSAIGNKSILIITEKNGAIDDGAAINFLVVGNRLKFELKAENATSRDIKLSSQLSEMAFKTY